LEGFALPVLNTPKQANGKLGVFIDGIMVGDRSDWCFAPMPQLR